MQFTFKHTCTDTHTEIQPVEGYISITAKSLLVCNESTGTDSLCSFTEFRSVDQPEVKLLTNDQPITKILSCLSASSTKIRDFVAFLLLFF